jgi:hypothetical protein
MGALQRVSSRNRQNIPPGRTTVVYTAGVAVASPPVVADGDVVGTREIAERLGVQLGTVHMWQQRRDTLNPPMPEPRGKVSGVPWWSWRDVQRWARKTGRLPEEP